MVKYGFVFQVDLEVEADSLEDAGMEIDGMLVNSPISGDKTWNEGDIWGVETLNNVGVILTSEVEALEAIADGETVEPWLSDEDGNGRWIKYISKIIWPNVYASRLEGAAYPQV